MSKRKYNDHINMSDWTDSIIIIGLNTYRENAVILLYFRPNYEELKYYDIF